MERLSTRNGGRTYRRRRFRRSRRGVVSVVGTLLALLVFFALFGIFLTQYLPLWMFDNESAFSSQAQASMATLKSNIDLQLALGYPPVYSTPFVMASSGVPLLAAPTTALLTFVPTTAGVFANVSMSVGPGGSAPLYRNYSLGDLTMYLPNRYYSPQTFVLEDDAVVESQSQNSQLMAFPPPLVINSTGSQVGVSVSLVQMLGNASQAVSTGTQQISSHFLFSQVFTSSGPSGGGTFQAELKVGTHYPCAWASFLSSTLNRSGVASSHFTLTPTGCGPSNGLAQLVDLKFRSISSFTLILGTVSIVMGVGVE